MIETNFATPVQRIMRRTVLAAILLLAILLAGSVTMLLGGRTLGQEEAKLQRDIASLATMRVEQHALGQETLRDYHHFKTRVAAINERSPLKGVGVNQLLTVIEQEIPKGVVVSRLQYSSADGQLVLVVSSAGYQPVYQLMGAMEKSRYFSAPELQQREARASALESAQQYEIRAMVRQP